MAKRTERRAVRLTEAEAEALATASELRQTTESEIIRRGIREELMRVTDAREPVTADR